jgi:Fur family transcriptional regulator, iron response regulator
LRPTRQRLALARLLLDGGRDRHITAEQLYTEATAAGIQLSLATVYNSLHQFTEVGLLRQRMIEPGHVHFDTNTGQHHHMVHLDTGEISDLALSDVDIGVLPKLPRGYELDDIQIVLRVKPQSKMAGNDNE